MSWIWAALRPFCVERLSVIEKFDVDGHGIRAVADLDRRAAETNPDVKIAIITSATFLCGMANMYALSHEAGGGSWVTETFEREEDARAGCFHLAKEVRG